MALETLLQTVDKCHDFASLYLLEDDLNNVGLTIQPAKSGKMLLCKIVESKPVLGKPIEDHIPVGLYGSFDEEISPSLKKTIIEFIGTNASNPGFVEHEVRSWNDTPGTYGDLSANVKAPVQAPQQNSDVIEIIAKNMPNTPIELEFGAQQNAKAVRIVFEDISTESDTDQIVEEMSRDALEALQSPTLLVETTLRKSFKHMDRLGLRPNATMIDSDREGYIIELPKFLSRRLGVSSRHIFEDLEEVVDLIEELNERFIIADA